MTTTLPNGVKTPTTADSVDPVSLIGAVANGFSDAIGGLGTGKRQPRSYRVADQTEKAALSGLTTLADGDSVLVADTGLIEMYDGTASAWKVMRTTKSQTWPYATQNITIGNGVATAAYTLDGADVQLSGSFTWGSTSAIAGSATGYDLVLPFTTVAPFHVPAGVCAYYKPNGNLVMGVVRLISGGARFHWYVGAAGGVTTGLVGLNTSTAINADDIISWNIRYRRAL